MAAEEFDEHATRVVPARPRVLVCDASEAWRSWMTERLVESFAVTPVPGGRELLAAFAGGPVAAVIVAPGDAESTRAAATLAVPVLWMVRGGTAAPASALNVLTPQMSPLLLRRTVAHVVASTPVRRPVERVIIPPPMAAPRPMTAVKVPPQALPALGQALRRLALQREPRNASRVVSAVLPRLLDADRATCFFVDQGSATAWHMADDPAGDKEGPLEGQLIGAAVQRRQLIVVDDLLTGPSRGPLDDPDGRGDERLLVQPVVSSGGDVHAVIVVARGARGESFRGEHIALLAAFAGRAAPLFDALAWDADAEAAQVEVAAASPFRREAMEAHRDRGLRGDVVRVHSPWVGWVYRLLCAFVLAVLAYVYFARVDEMASGPGVVVAEGRADVVSFVPGVIAEVLVTPGQRVEVGQQVARLLDEEAEERVAAFDAELDQLVVERLAAPDDAAVAGRLAALNSQREQAIAAREQLVLRASVAGTAGERFVEPGAKVNAGDAVVSIVTGGEAAMSLVAALPAGMRPMLRVGQTARVVLADHPGEPVLLRVAEITEDAFGPAAARRRLGNLLGDAVPLAGSVVFVRLALPEGGFVASGKRFAFHHGMLAGVDVTVRRERLGVALVPGLKEVFGSDY